MTSELPPSVYDPLPWGSVRPLGMLPAQMRRDLADGLAGHLDELTDHAAADSFHDRVGSSSDQVG